MSADQRKPDSSSGYRKTDPELLRITQEYLELQFRRVAPRSAVVRAWQQFYGTYNEIIRRFALSCGVPKADLDECVQDVWTAVIAQLGGFKYNPSRGRFRSWLYAMVRNKATDLVRRKNRHPTLFLRDPVVLDQYPSSSDGDPVSELERRWNKGLVHGVLTQLRKKVSERSFQVFYMRRIEHQSVKAVAKELRLTPAAVRTRQHRMERKFRACLERYTGDQHTT